MEKVYYSNVLIPKQLDWRFEATHLIEDIMAGFRLVNTTRSGNWVVQISSAEKKNLKKILDRAIEKY